MSFDNLSGQFLGQYELRDALGQGGMGAVYRAVQANLKRDVAIKILPTSLALQPGYLDRFTREAEIAAALQHPHIVPIIDYGMQRGISYVVMRLLTGGSLAQRINQRMSDGQSLPSLGEAAQMLTQLASALDYAHSQGVIHRDIKTSNIMFDDQGNAYVVDFGIAKLQGASQNLTSTGMALGTSAYMPPEQWRSEPLTPTADQYAMAVTLYILLTGRVPYDSDTPGGLMYKHFNEMPTPPQQYRAGLPEKVSDVLNHALAKKPEDRYFNMAAFAQAFQQAISGHEGKPNGFFTFKVRGTPRPAPVTPISPPSGPSTVSLTPPVDPTPSDHIPTVVQPTPLPIPPLKPTVQREPTNSRMYWALGGIVIVLLGAVALFFMNRQPNVALPPTSTVTETSTAAPVPTLTYTSTTANIALVATATSTIQPSPTLTVTSTSTSTPSPSLTATLSLTPSLTSTPTATLTESPTATATFTRIPSATATSTPTTSYTVTASQTNTSTPVQASIHSFSANTYSSTANSAVELTWETESERTRIVELTANYTVIKSYDVSATGSLIVYIPNDAKDRAFYRLVVTSGSDIRTNLITIIIRENIPTATATPAVSTSALPGRIVFTSQRDANPEIYYMDPAKPANSERLTNNAYVDSHPVLSHDGNDIAFNSNHDGNYKIYVLHFDGSNLRPETENNNANTNPSWSPDGKRIVYTSVTNGKSQIYTVDLNLKLVQLISQNPYISDLNPSWSPTIDQIIFESVRSGEQDIYALSVNGITRIPINLTKTGVDKDPSWSPDGKQIAFASKRDGNYEIYVMNADGSNQHRLTNSHYDDGQPTWSPDGQYIAFVSDRSGNRDIWVMKAADGGIVANLTADSGTDDYDPDWGVGPNSSAAIAPATLTTTQGVNVRSGPSTVFDPPLGSLAANQTVDLLARSPDGQWFKIKYYNDIGWVFAAYTKPSVDPGLLIVDAGLP